MQFLVAVGPRDLTERSKFGEHRNHPRVGLWCFVVGVVDLMGSLEETPRETQVAAESFVQPMRSCSSRACWTSN